MIRILPLFALVLALVGCETNKVMIGDPYFAKVKSKANVYARQSQAGVLKIAVMPFKASTELIGSSVSDMVVTELLRTQKYALVERGQMKNVLSETELAMAGLSESKAVEAAKMLGAEAVVIGTVDEYVMQAKGGDTYAVVGLSIRLIDCSTAKIVWSADLAKMADEDDTPLAAHAREVVHELVSGLYQNLMGQVGDLPPPTPLGIEVGDMGLREAVVRWTPPQYSAKYRVERASSEGGPFASVGEADAKAGRFVDKKGLKDGTTYYYRVLAVGRAGTASDPSAVGETMTAPPPDPPAGVGARAPSSRCVAVSWVPPRSEGVTSYRVERSSGGSGWKIVGTATEAKLKDGGVAGCDLADSTAYRYRVIAVNRVGAESLPSAEAEVETLPPPAEVAGFKAASRGIRCVPIAWAPNAEKDVSGYELEKAEGPGGEFKPLAKLGKGGTSFLDGKSDPGNLLDEQEYRYRIRAFNDVGGQSKWAVAKAVTKPAPKAPAGLKATTDVAGSVVLAWQKNPEPDIAEYRVEVRGASGAGGWFWSKLATTQECQAEDRGLDPGQRRVYRVMAVGPKNHQSAWSSECEGSARPLPPPPHALRAEKSDGGWRVTFSPAREGMTEYRVYRKKFVGRDLLDKVTKPEAVVSSATVGEGMDIVVTELDEQGLESEPSEKLSIGK